MNPITHVPLSVEAFPVRSSNGSDIPGLFHLGMRYRPEGGTQWIFSAHIPESLQPAVLAGDVKALHVEMLDTDSAASRSLVGMPKYVVLSVATKKNIYMAEIPKGFTRARLSRYVIGVVACAAGFALISYSFAWAGAGALAMGTHVLRTAAGIPALFRARALGRVMSCYDSLHKA